MSLKIEAGKHYRTRGGRKAYVAGINPEADVLYQVVGWVGPTSFTWGTNGWYAEAGESSHDLIEPWHEPAQFKVGDRVQVAAQWGQGVVEAVECKPDTWLYSVRLPLRRDWFFEDSLTLAPERRGRFWVNVYKTGPGVYNHTTRKEADNVSHADQRIACVEVEWTEGQGLEGGK